MNTPEKSLSLLADAARERSLLFVTSDGAAAEARFAVDPTLAAALEAAGARVNQASYRMLDDAMLAAHDVVVLGGFPKTDAPEMVALVLGEMFPAILRAVRGGLGLLIMVDDHYSRLFDPLNKALAPLGIEVLCEDVFDSDPGRNGVIPTSPEIATLLADAAAHPSTENVRSVLLPCGWQSGAWPLRLSDSSWQPLLVGSATCEARVLRKESPGLGGKKPALAAARTLDHGRIALLPAHSTFFFGNGLHPRWDGGHFFGTADNGKFLAGLVSWLCSKPPCGSPAPKFDLPGSGIMPWFTEIPADAQPLRFQPQRGLVAIRPGPEGTGVTELARAAREAGFAWAVFAPREEDMGDWNALVAQCLEASDESFSALPGVDFVAAQDYGARGLAVLPTFWPPRSTNRRFVIQMIEEGGGWQILSSPDKNAMPPWNIGGFQGMEIGCPGSIAEEMFFRLQSHDWFLAPVARHRVSSVEEVMAAGKHESTYVLADSPGDVARRLPKVGDCEFSEVFVSGGPVLREFWTEGPGATLDVWEGRYYTWSDDPDEVLKLHVAITSDRPLREVTLWESGRVLARYRPGTTEFRTTYIKPNDRSSRGYWVTAVDDSGGRLVSMARRTKSGLFRTHGGGDRMNTYGSVLLPCERGEFLLRGRRCSTSATLLFGLGWRQHHLNIYPPVPAVDYHPEGGEWGAPNGRLERISLNPLLARRAGLVGGRVLEDRLGFEFTSDEAAFLTEVIEREEVLPIGGRSHAPQTYLEKYSPDGSHVVAIREFRATGRYLFGRWDPEGGPVVARFEREIVFLEDVEPDPAAAIPLRILRMQSDSDEFLRSVFVRGSEQPPLSAPLDGFRSTPHPLGTNAVAGLFPQPYGAFGFVQLEGPPLHVRVTNENGVVGLEAGVVAPASGRWKTGETLRFVMLLVVGGKSSDQAELFENASARPCSVRQGRLVEHGYPTVIEASGGIASCHMGAPESRVPALVEIRGFREGDSVRARELRKNESRPLALHGGTAYLTVPPEWSEIEVGKLSP